MCQACADAKDAGATSEASFVLTGFPTGTEWMGRRFPRAPAEAKGGVMRSFGFGAEAEGSGRFGATAKSPTAAAFRARAIAAAVELREAHATSRVAAAGVTVGLEVPWAEIVGRGSGKSSSHYIDDGGPDEVDLETLGTFIDMHSHNFCATESDWELTASGYPTFAATQTDQRIDWLADLYDSGVTLMAISGMVDTTAGDGSITDGRTLDDITLHAVDRYPDFLLPFLRGFDLSDPDAPSYIADRLADGEFLGVGELFVHGYSDFEDTDALVAIFAEAAAAGVPVLVHWEFGSMNDRNTTWTTEDCYNHLLAVLDQFPNEPILGYRTESPDDPVPVKVIIAHCGAGPNINSETIEQYTIWLDTLLSDSYPNVYFDLSGMQIEGVVSQLFRGDGTLTELGVLLLDRMGTKPSRFLLGVDTENRFEEDVKIDGHWGAKHYAASVQNYRDFITHDGILDVEHLALIRGWNAFFALFVRANAPMM